MKISDIKQNPANPRTIKDEKFDLLVKSIKEFPEMMVKRPMVCVTDVDGKLYPLGGNMRLKAIKKLKMDEIPDEWVMLADDWTAEQRKEFTIKDNVGFGEWNFEQLEAEWDLEQLADWGLDLTEFEGVHELDEPTDLIAENKNKAASLKITFESIDQLQKAEIDIQELIDRKYKGAYFSVSAGEL